MEHFTSTLCALVIASSSFFARMLLRVLAVLQLLGAARAAFGDQQGVRMTLTDEGDAGSDEVCWQKPDQQGSV